MRTKTETIIGALRVLAQDIQSEDGVSNAAIAEAADRIEELWSVVEKYADAGKICAKIYIARNISLSEKDVVSALAEIDKLYREENHN